MLYILHYIYLFPDVFELWWVFVHFEFFIDFYGIQGLLIRWFFNLLCEAKSALVIIFNFDLFCLLYLFRLFFLICLFYLFTFIDFIQIIYPLTIDIGRLVQRRRQFTRLRECFSKMNNPKSSFSQLLDNLIFTQIVLKIFFYKFPLASQGSKIDTSLIHTRISRFWAHYLQSRWRWWSSNNGISLSEGLGISRFL